MAPPIAPKNQPAFDDEISLLDIIHFFKTNVKRIILFSILGGILGALYGKLVSPVYEGSILLAPAKVLGAYVIDPKVTLTKLNMNSYYSKETFLACSPEFYKDKDIDYDMSDIVKTTITQDGSLLNLSLTHKKKSVITDCLTHVENDIRLSQKTLADPLIEMKRNELQLLQNKLKISEDFRQRLNEKQLKNLKTNELRFSTDVLYVNIVLNNAAEIKNLMDQINKITTDLSSEQTREAGKVLPINIEKKSFPSLKLCLLLGLFFGVILGSFLSAYKNLNLKNSKAR